MHSMPLSIEDDQTDELARRLAGLTGETITTAVKEALRERLEREGRRRGKAGRAGRLLEIGQRCAAHMPEPARSLDHGDFLYDEQGLPK
jgi:antitoxin VapB